MKPIDIMMLLDQESEYVTETGCRIWTGQTWSNGYGRVKDQRVHRLVWEAVHGPIPPGLLVCHSCDVRPCANVEHFFLGTHKDNMADCARKGRKKNSAATRTKMSLGHLGRSLSAKHCESIQAAKIGKKHSLERCAKNRAGQLGKILSVEHRLAISKGNQGTKRSAETRMKQSIARTAYWARRRAEATR